MERQVVTYEECPFEEGQVYDTKGGDSEKFKIVKIIYGLNQNKLPIITGFQGIYLKRKHLGVCPLGGDRLVALRKSKKITVNIKIRLKRVKSPRKS